MNSRLYLLPAPLGEVGLYALPVYANELLKTLRFFFVENEREARRFIARTLKASGESTASLNECAFLPLDERASDAEIETFFQKSETFGLLSDAGCPSVADPGARAVRAAHKLGVRVVPVVGPSSILLTLMASGLNGQRFTFVGYLPIKAAERRTAIQVLERRARDGETQLFIETPYRNHSLLDDLLKFCGGDLRLCVATDLTLETEYIFTQTLARWKAAVLPDLHKRPTVFAIGL